jgi:hypothetical protein
LAHDLDSPDPLPIAEPLDAPVSFETIEHTREDYWLHKFRSCLRPGGLLVMSAQLAPGDRRIADGNPHHPRLYTSTEFVDLLTGLGNVTWGEGLPQARRLDDISKRLGRGAGLDVVPCTLRREADGSR